MLFLQPEPSLKTEKAAARRWARQTRAAFTPEQWAAFGAAIAQRLCLLPQWQAAQTVFCFASHGPEPDTLPLLQAALAEGKQLCVPRCTGPGQMEAIPLGDLALLAPGSYEIPEPPAQLPPCPPAGIQLAVLPCLAAGLDGIRRELTPPEPMNRNLYTAEESVTAALRLLPATLEEAKQIAAESSFLKEILPEGFLY